MMKISSKWRHFHFFACPKPKQQWHDITDDSYIAIFQNNMWIYKNNKYVKPAIILFDGLFS